MGTSDLVIGDGDWSPALARLGQTTDVSFQGVDCRIEIDIARNCQNNPDSWLYFEGFEWICLLMRGRSKPCLGARWTWRRKLGWENHRTPWRSFAMFDYSSHIEFFTFHPFKDRAKPIWTSDIYIYWIILIYGLSGRPDINPQFLSINERLGSAAFLQGAGPRTTRSSWRTADTADSMALQRRVLEMFFAESHRNFKWFQWGILN